ncbi:hypothetical protein [Aureimonas sp. AU22]|uniref:hypothetical protein n=1 Tax=Aureimonas sp. AU22 TaxID=1638162 RepID=UPI000AF805E5|nr:hypothetical protein [Aureimonas sp. AU22]
MDSMQDGEGTLLKFWRVLFGGSEGTGMTKLMVFLAAYILVFGLLFAFATR